MNNLVRKTIRDMSPYSWEPSSSSIAYKLGIKENQVIRFDTNTSPYGLPSGSLKKIKISEYPDASYEELTKLIARYAGVKEDRIVIGAGADEIIDIVARTFLEKGDKALISTPTYSLFKIVVQLSGGIPIEIARNKDYELNTERVISETKKTNSKLIFICNPNNPTGNLTPVKDLAKIAESVESVVVLDEAYYEFCGKTSLRYLKNRDNVVIIRTLSKVGLAGIRLGYAVAPSLIAKAMNKTRPPNSVSAYSLKTAENTLQNTRAIQKNVCRSNIEKSRLMKGLQELGLFVYPSSGNFLMVRTAQELANRVYEKLWEKGLIISNLANKELTKGCLRIGVRSRKENCRLLSELKIILDSKYDAVIFDVDGVLVDVSKSYYEAIKRTASVFLRREVVDFEVDKLKSLEGFNNDWDVTFALVKGITNPSEIDRSSRPYKEIKEIFQGLYLGNENQPGLISNETLLISKKTLKKLKREGISIGVVTGRPRKEALIALGSLMGNYIQADNIVALEDCDEEKPSPKSLKKLIGKMLCRNPIYIGDNPSDVSAANSMGIPIAVVGNQAVGEFYLQEVNDLLKVVRI